MEMKRLREGTGCMLPYPGLLGSLVVADMRLPLKPEFMAKLGTSHGRLSLLVSLVILHHDRKKRCYSNFAKCRPIF